MKTEIYSDIQEYLDDIDYTMCMFGVELGDLDYIDDDEREDLQNIINAFRTDSVSEKILDTLCNYLCGCGGTVAMSLITKKDADSLQSNQDAIKWLENNVQSKKDYHYNDDWSNLECSIQVIGNCYILESFMQG